MYADKDIVIIVGDHANAPSFSIDRTLLVSKAPYFESLLSYLSNCPINGSAITLQDPLIEPDAFQAVIDYIQHDAYTIPPNPIHKQAHSRTLLDLHSKVYILGNFFCMDDLKAASLQALAQELDRLDRYIISDKRSGLLRKQWLSVILEPLVERIYGATARNDRARLLLARFAAVQKLRLWGIEGFMGLLEDLPEFEVDVVAAAKKRPREKFGAVLMDFLGSE